MLIIGHRKNSIDEINNTKSLGVDMIEIDIRVTKDNIPVLYHDERIQGTNLIIEESTFEKLRGSFTNLTKLEDALSVKGVNYLLEIKPKVDIEPIVSTLSKHKTKNDLLITSFDFKLLKKIKNDLPEIKVAVLDRWSGVRANRRANKLKTKIIIMNQLWLWNGFIRAVKNSGFDLYVYTLNDVHKAKIWNNYGLAGVITDKPSDF